jgi:phosphoribosyl 1,2-cyclic phosphodiesterase
VRAVSLYSGSGGNCTLIDTGSKRILIDAGGSAKTVCEALNAAGSDIALINAVFITHEHSDHTHALEVLLKKHPMPVHIMKNTYRALKVKEGTALHACAVVHESEYTEHLGSDCTVEAFLVPHDSVCCVGYKIVTSDDSVGVVTDIGYVTQRVYDCLCGCNAVMIEANHDIDMVKRGSYPDSLKRRILSGGGHLSNRDCAQICGALARQGTKHVLLMHMSLENNDPKIALNEVLSSVNAYGVSVETASADCPTVLK